MPRRNLQREGSSQVAGNLTQSRWLELWREKRHFVSVLMVVFVLLDMVEWFLLNPLVALVLFCWLLLVPLAWEIKICIRTVYYLLKSIARRTSLEIRELTLPGPGPF